MNTFAILGTAFATSPEDLLESTIKELATR